MLIRPSPANETPVDALLVGAGAVGLALGIALAQAGLRVALAGLPETRPNGRTVALLEGSIALLARLGVWPLLEREAEPLRVMRLVDATGSLFRGPPVEFRATEIGRADFGRNIENHRLVATLAEAADAEPGLARCPARLEDFVFGADLARARGDGQALAARLVIATDGRRSSVRDAAGITARETLYRQDALTATLEHSRPHGGVSTEFHTRYGPFTLVPLPALGAAPHRSSLVWGMTPDDAERRPAFPPERLAREIERQSGMLLGRITVSGPVGRFPVGQVRVDRLVGRRIALAGEAGHAMAPIGAQGLNLSLRDVAGLAEILGRAKSAGEDVGAPGVLQRYARARECVAVGQKLWDTWEDDAFIRDREAGLFFEPSKQHAVHHEGAFFKVDGALNIARPPQGQPVIIQAGASDAGKALAAETAEVVFGSAVGIEAGRAYYADLKGRMPGFGRRPEALKLLAGMPVVVGESMQEADDKYAQLQAMIHPDVGRQRLSTDLEVDLSGLPLDEPVPEDLIPATSNFHKGYFDEIARMIRQERPTLRQLYMRYERGTRSVRGTPGHVADVLEEWFTTGAADGFMFIVHLQPAGLADIVDKVVPELQRRGLFRREYEGRTLRDHLGLARPANRHALSSSRVVDAREQAA